MEFSCDKVLSLHDMETRQQRKDNYHHEAAGLQQRINRMKARGRQFVTGEIASFLGIIAFIVAITLSESEL